MKLTKEQVEHLRGTKSFKTEGIIRRIFANLVAKKLKKDPDFKKAVDTADKSMETLKQRIKSAEAKGIEIPDSIKKQVGLK